MSDGTGIEWTDATWNPVTGCDKVSPGCDHCYAETIAHRFAGTPAYPDGFKVTLRPERLDQPLRWKRPRMVFVNSMSDLFHKDIPDDYIARVFAVMAEAHQHTFQILTKRHGRMRALLNSPDFYDAVDREWCGLSDWYWGRMLQNNPDSPLLTGPAGRWPLPNVWLGVSAEDQKRANLRIHALLNTPAAVRFVSAEPLIGSIDLRETFARMPAPRFDGDELRVRDVLHWVIVGGESGAGARPMDPDWVRLLRDQCVAAGITFFFKQWGEWAPKYVLRHERAIPPGPKVHAEHLIQSDQGIIRMHRVGKKAAGRELDHREHIAWPERVTE